MGLADDVFAALSGLRQEAESMMRDFGVMRRPTGRAVQNADGEEEPEFVDVFRSRCKVQAESGKDIEGRVTTVGGVERLVIAGGLHLPVGAPATRRGYVFQVTKVGDLSDVRLLGKRYFVDDDPVKSNATARRLDVVEV